MNTKAAHQPSRRHRRLAPAIALAGALLAAAPAAAAVVRYVSTILDGPSAPTSLIVQSDRVAALEPFAGQVEVFTADGVLTGQVDVTGEARGLARLRDEVYLFCDRAGSRVSAVNLADGSQTVFLSLTGEPADVIVAGGECFVLDSTNRRILTCDLSGNVVATLEVALPPEAAAGWLSALAWDASREIFYVFEQVGCRVHAFARDGSSLGAFCTFGGAEGEVSRGGDLVCDTEGWIYVTDRYQGRVVVFDPAWRFVVNVDPLALGRDRLRMPTGLAVDETGLIYVSATEGSAIHVFHLDKSTSAAGQLLAVPVSPAAGDTLAVNGLQFVAGVQGPADAAASLVADFRLVDPADPGFALAEGIGLPLVDGTVVGDIVIGSIVWRPVADLEPGRQYGWQARTRAGQEAGAWMALRTFTPAAALLRFRLEQNTPNPFNPRTVIPFSLRDGSRADLAIFDLQGRRVWHRDLSGFGPGSHRIAWQGTDDRGVALPSGIYFYRLVSGTSVATCKMVLVR